MENVDRICILVFVTFYVMMNKDVIYGKVKYIN